MIFGVAASLLIARTIDFEIKATRVPLILEQLQAKSGIKLSCAGEFESEVMLISSKSVTPGILLDKFAKACAGEWEKKGDILYLRPNMKQRAAEESARLELRISRIQGILDRCKKELESPFAPDSTSIPSNPANPVPPPKTRNLPLPRCAMRLLIAIGAPRLAQIPLGGRTVFAVSANQNQVPLPKDAGQALKTFFGEWRIAEKAGVGVGGATRMNGAGELITPEHSLPKVWLSVSDLLGRGIYPSVFLGMVDGQGSGVGGGLDLEGMATFAPKFVPDLSEDRLVYSADTLAFKALMGTQANRGRTPIKPGSTAAKLLTREEFEPLSLGSELLDQYAEKKKSNLVALIPDTALRPLISLQTTTMKTVKECIDILFSQETTDGWLILAPTRPSDARRLRDSRKSLRLLLQDAGDGHLSLEREAEYLLSRPMDAPSGLGILMANFLDGELPQQYPRYEYRAKRLYGLLPAPSRRAGSSAYRELPPRVREELANCVFQDGALTYHADPAPFERNPFDNFAVNIGFNEPTLIWEAGIPDDAVFDVSPGDSLAVRAYSSSQPYSNFGETLQTAAYVRFMQENPTLVRDPNDISRRIDLFQPLSERFYGFVLRHNSWASAYWAIDRKSLGAPCPYSQLPKNVQEAVEKEKERIKAARGTKPPSDTKGGRAGNPPPR